MTDTSNNNARKLLNITSSPALMAVEMSDGAWRLARHLALLDQAVLKLIRRELASNILLVKMPPRHGKSEYLCNWVPAWFLGKWPEKRVILCGYEATFAATWGRKAREAYASLHQYGLPRTLALDKQASNEWETEQRGGMRTAGVGGGITGRGGDLLVTDDLTKNSEEAQSETYREKTWDWWRSTAFTRLQPDGICIVVGTPWHRDDVLAKIERDLNPYVFEFPAIATNCDKLGRQPGDALWPQQFTASNLHTIKETIGPYWWNALYQLRPTAHERAEWPTWYFDDHIWIKGEFPNKCQLGVITIDLSRGGKRGDFSANIFTGFDGRGYVVDATVARRPAEKIVDDTIDQALLRNPNIIVAEGNGSQHLIVTLLEQRVKERGLPPLPIVAVDSVGNKEDRIRRLGPRFERKTIRILKNAGGELLVNQLRDFPLGDFDDGPDALEMGIRHLNGMARLLDSRNDTIVHAA